MSKRTLSFWFMLFSTQLASAHSLRSQIQEAARAIDVVRAKLETLQVTANINIEARDQLSNDQAWAPIESASMPALLTNANSLWKSKGNSWAYRFASDSAQYQGQNLAERHQTHDDKPHYYLRTNLDKVFDSKRFFDPVAACY